MQMVKPRTPLRACDAAEPERVQQNIKLACLGTIAYHINHPFYKANSIIVMRLVKGNAVQCNGAKIIVEKSVGL